MSGFPGRGRARPWMNPLVNSNRAWFRPLFPPNPNVHSHPPNAWHSPRWDKRPPWRFPNPGNNYRPQLSYGNPYDRHNETNYHSSSSVPFNPGSVSQNPHYNSNSNCDSKFGTRYNDKRTRWDNGANYPNVDWHVDYDLDNGKYKASCSHTPNNSKPNEDDGKLEVTKSNEVKIVQRQNPENTIKVLSVENRTSEKVESIASRSEKCNEVSSSSSAIETKSTSRVNQNNPTFKVNSHGKIKHSKAKKKNKSKVKNAEPKNIPKDAKKAKQKKKKQKEVKATNKVLKKAVQKVSITTQEYCQDQITKAAEKVKKHLQECNEGREEVLENLLNKAEGQKSELKTAGPPIDKSRFDLELHLTPTDLQDIGKINKHYSSCLSPLQLPSQEGLCASLPSVERAHGVRCETTLTNLASHVTGNPESIQLSSDSNTDDVIILSSPEECARTLDTCMPDILIDSISKKDFSNLSFENVCASPCVSSGATKNLIETDNSLINNPVEIVVDTTSNSQPQIHNKNCKIQIRSDLKKIDLREPKNVNTHTESVSSSLKEKSRNPASHHVSNSSANHRDSESRHRSISGSPHHSSKSPSHRHCSISPTCQVNSKSPSHHLCSEVSHSANSSSRKKHISHKDSQYFSDSAGSSPHHRTSKSSSNSACSSPCKNDLKKQHKQHSGNPSQHISKSPSQNDSKCISHCLSKGPGYHGSKSPACHESKSPVHHESKSPVHHESKSPVCHESKSPGCHRSRSPDRHKSNSPSHHDSKNCGRHESQSPAQRQSKTPVQRENERKQHLSLLSATRSSTVNNSLRCDLSKSVAASKPNDFSSPRSSLSTPRCGSNNTSISNVNKTSNNSVKHCSNYRKSNVDKFVSNKSGEKGVDAKYSKDVKVVPKISDLFALQNTNVLKNCSSSVSKISSNNYKISHRISKEFNNTEKNTSRTSKSSTNSSKKSGSSKVTQNPLKYVSHVPSKYAGQGTQPISTASPKKQTLNSQKNTDENNINIDNNCASSLMKANENWETSLSNTLEDLALYESVESLTDFGLNDFQNKDNELSLTGKQNDRREQLCKGNKSTIKVSIKKDRLAKDNFANSPASQPCEEGNLEAKNPADKVDVYSTNSSTATSGRLSQKGVLELSALNVNTVQDVSFNSNLNTSSMPSASHSDVQSIEKVSGGSTIHPLFIPNVVPSRSRHSSESVSPSSSEQQDEGRGDKFQDTPIKRTKRTRSASVNVDSEESTKRRKSFSGCGGTSSVKSFGDIINNQLKNINLKDMVNNPSLNRKAELVMQHLMKEHNQNINRKLRMLAEAQMLSNRATTSVDDTCVSLNLQDPLDIDTDLAVDLAALPPEFIENLQNLLDLDIGTGADAQTGDITVGTDMDSSLQTGDVNDILSSSLLGGIEEPESLLIMGHSNIDQNDRADLDDLAGGKMSDLNLQGNLEYVERKIESLKQEIKCFEEYNPNCDKLENQIDVKQELFMPDMPENLEFIGDAENDGQDTKDFIKELTEVQKDDSIFLQENNLCNTLAQENLKDSSSTLTPTNNCSETPADDSKICNLGVGKKAADGVYPETGLVGGRGETADLCDDSTEQGFGHDQNLQDSQSVCNIDENIMSGEQFAGYDSIPGSNVSGYVVENGTNMSDVGDLTPSSGVTPYNTNDNIPSFEASDKYAADDPIERYSVDSVLSGPTSESQAIFCTKEESLDIQDTSSTFEAANCVIDSPGVSSANCFEEKNRNTLVNSTKSPVNELNTTCVGKVSEHPVSFKHSVNSFSQSPSGASKSISSETSNVILKQLTTEAQPSMLCNNTKPANADQKIDFRADILKKETDGYQWGSQPFDGKVCPSENCSDPSNTQEIAPILESLRGIENVCSLESTSLKGNALSVKFNSVDLSASLSSSVAFDSFATDDVRSNPEQRVLSPCVQENSFQQLNLHSGGFNPSGSRNENFVLSTTQNNTFVSSSSQNNNYATSSPQNNTYVTSSSHKGSYAQPTPQNNYVLPSVQSGAYVQRGAENNGFVQTNSPHDAFDPTSTQQSGYEQTSSQLGGFVQTSPHERTFENASIGSQVFPTTPQEYRFASETDAGASQFSGANVLNYTSPRDYTATRSPSAEGVYASPRPRRAAPSSPREERRVSDVCTQTMEPPAVPGAPDAVLQTVLQLLQRQRRGSEGGRARAVPPRQRPARPRERPPRRPAPWPPSHSHSLPRARRRQRPRPRSPASWLGEAAAARDASWPREASAASDRRHGRWRFAPSDADDSADDTADLALADGAVNFDAAETFREMLRVDKEMQWLLAYKMKLYKRLCGRDGGGGGGGRGDPRVSSCSRPGEGDGEGDGDDVGALMRARAAAAASPLGFGAALARRLPPPADPACPSPQTTTLTPARDSCSGSPSSVSPRTAGFRTPGEASVEADGPPPPGPPAPGTALGLGLGLGLASPAAHASKSPDCSDAAALKGPDDSPPTALAHCPADYFRLCSSSKAAAQRPPAAPAPAPADATEQQLRDFTTQLMADVDLAAARSAARKMDGPLRLTDTALVEAVLGTFAEAKAEPDSTEAPPAPAAAPVPAPAPKAPARAVARRGRHFAGRRRPDGPAHKSAQDEDESVPAFKRQARSRGGKTAGRGGGAGGGGCRPGASPGGDAFDPDDAARAPPDSTRLSPAADAFGSEGEAGARGRRQRRAPLLTLGPCTSPSPHAIPASAPALLPHDDLPLVVALAAARGRGKRRRPAARTASASASASPPPPPADASPPLDSGDWLVSPGTRTRRRVRGGGGGASDTAEDWDSASPLPPPPPPDHSPLLLRPPPPSLPADAPSSGRRVSRKRKMDYNDIIEPLDTTIYPSVSKADRSKQDICAKLPKVERTNRGEKAERTERTPTKAERKRVSLSEKEAPSHPGCSTPEGAAPLSTEEPGDTLLADEPRAASPSLETWSPSDQPLKLKLTKPKVEAGSEVLKEEQESATSGESSEDEESCNDVSVQSEQPIRDCYIVIEPIDVSQYLNKSRAKSGNDAPEVIADASTSSDPPEALPPPQPADPAGELGCEVVTVDEASSDELAERPCGGEDSSSVHGHGRARSPSPDIIILDDVTATTPAPLPADHHHPAAPKRPRLDERPAPPEDFDRESVSSSDGPAELADSPSKASRRKPRKRKRKSDVEHIVFDDHGGPILDVKTVGRHVLAACEDGSVYCYSLKSGKLKRQYSGHSAAVICLVILLLEGPDGEDPVPEYLYTGCLDHQLRCFHFKTGALVNQPVNLGKPIQCMDENWGTIFMGTKTGEIVKFYTKSFKLNEDYLKCCKDSVLAIKATKEGARKIIIVAARNEPVTIRDANSGLLMRVIGQNLPHTVYSLLLESSLVYCGTKTGKIPVFSFTSGEEVCKYNAGYGVVCMRVYNHLLFAGCYDGNIYIYSTQDKSFIRCIPGPGKMLLCLDVVKNRIIAGSKDNRLEAWPLPPDVKSCIRESRHR